MNSPFRLLLNEKNPSRRVHLRGILEKEKKFKVLTTYDPFETLADICFQKKVDLCIAGIDSFKIGMSESFLPLWQLGNRYKVLILSNCIQREMMLKAMHAGIKGCLPKNLEDWELIQAVWEICSGGIWYQKRMGEAHSCHDSQNKGIQDFNGHKGRGLTSQEMRILEKVKKGFRNKEIAAHFDISEKTVKCHVHKIFKKLKINKRTDIIQA